MTNTEKNQDTKQRILKAANELFAKNGYGATSVRDIATEAEVNLAAINYHFKNKENLYWKVFDYNYDWMTISINALGEKTKTTAELAVATFNFFNTSGSAVMNTFKIFLSDNISPPEEELVIDKEECFGPPGAETFLAKIQSDLKDDSIPEQGYIWAVRMIFAQLVHFGVIMNTSTMKRKCQQSKDISPEIISTGIFHSTNAHLDYLKKNKNLFK